MAQAFFMNKKLAGNINKNFYSLSERVEGLVSDELQQLILKLHRESKICRS